MRKLYHGVKTWLQDKLGSVFKWLGDKIKSVTGFFYDMYDAVVGHSYVPDMVEGIAKEFARLDALMVDPARDATKSTTDRFKQMASDVRGLMASLFPEIEAFKKYKDDLALIESSGLTDEAKREARSRLYDQSSEGFAMPDRSPITATDVKSTNDLLNEQVELIDIMAPKVATIGTAWQNAMTTLSEYSSAAFDAVASNIEGVLMGAKSLGDALRDLAKQLISMAMQALVFAPLKASLGIPGFAKGTSFAPGGMALVGERGPELVNLPRGSQVIPNHKLDGTGAQQIHKPTFVFPGITDAKMAREAAGQAARRYRRELNPMRV
jgi:phage-related protein